MSSLKSEATQLVESTKDFVTDSVNFINRCTKPDKKEFIKIASSCAIGFAVMGVVGYLIKLVDSTHFEQVGNIPLIPSKTFKSNLKRPESAKVLAPINRFLQPQIKNENELRPISAYPNNIIKKGTIIKKNQQSILPEIQGSQTSLQKNNSNENVADQYLTKIRPKFFKMEKERLNEDTFHLKNLLMMIQEENNNLRSKMYKNEEENVKLETTISNVESFVTKKFLNDNKNGKTTFESNFVIGLRKQINELNKTLEEKEDKLKHLKKTYNYLKYMEKETEIKVFLEEINRLNSLYSESNQNKKNEKNEPLIDEFFIQGPKFEELRDKYAELFANFQILQEENIDLSAKFSTHQTNKDKINSIYQQKKTQINEKSKEINQLKNEINMKKLDLNKIIIKSQNMLKEQAKSENINASEQMKAQILQKDQILQNQTKSIKDMAKKLEEIKQAELDEQRKLQNDIITLKQNNIHVEEKYKDLSKKNEERLKEIYNGKSPSHVKMLTKNNIAHFRETDEIMLELTNDKLNLLEQKFFKKVPTVKSYDVKQYGYELNIRFRILKLDINTVMNKYLFNDYMKRKNTVKLKDLINLLNGYPFFIENQDGINLVARFLIEDNNRDHIEYDLERTNKMHIVKSIFKHLIGNYHIISNEEEEKLRNSIIQLISKYRNSIFQSFDLISDLKGNKLVSNKAIEDIFKFLDIEISNAQLEYIFIELFKFSNNIQLLEYKKILEIFNEKYVFTKEIPFLDRMIDSIKDDGDDTKKYNKFQRMGSGAGYDGKNSVMMNSSILNMERSMQIKFEFDHRLKYFGIYQKKNQKIPLFFRNLKFLSTGEIEGFDNDDVGKYMVYGSYTEKTFKFTKEYMGKHKIEYEGTIEDSYKLLKGKWHLGDNDGDFLLKLADRIFKFTCTTTRSGLENKTKGVFALVDNNTIEGIGNEEGIPYVWEGNLEEENKISLIKNYSNGGCMNFEGDIEGFMIKGRYNIEDELGEFEFKFEESFDEDQENDY